MLRCRHRRRVDELGPRRWGWERGDRRLQKRGREGRRELLCWSQGAWLPVFLLVLEILCFGGKSSYICSHSNCEKRPSDHNDILEVLCAFDDNASDKTRGGGIGDAGHGLEGSMEDGVLKGAEKLDFKKRALIQNAGERGGETETM